MQSIAVIFSVILTLPTIFNSSVGLVVPIPTLSFVSTCNVGESTVKFFVTIKLSSKVSVSFVTA